MSDPHHSQRPTEPAPPLSDRATLIEERPSQALIDGLDQRQLLRELQAMYYDGSGLT